MDIILFKTIVDFKKKGEFKGNVVFQDNNERQKYRKRFSKLSLLKNGTLKHPKGIVPSWANVDKAFKKIHYKKKLHCIEKKHLVSVLVAAGFYMPKFLGGLERVVGE